MTINEKIASLRAAMSAQAVDAYLIPSSDPHQSEYVTDYWKGRQWISGFTGSAGIAIVTADHAGVWTDSRYFIQAEQELSDSEFQLHRQQVPYAPEHITWLQENLSAGAQIGLDGRLFSKSQIEQFQNAFQPKNIQLQTELDLLSEIWTDRPPLPEDPVFEQPKERAGYSRNEKLEQIREKMKDHQVSGYLVTALDEVAWAFNLRGTDVEYNPVFYAYAFIELDIAHLFIQEEKIPDELKKQLQKDLVRTHPYHDILEFLSGKPADQRILIDTNTLNYQLWSYLSEDQMVANSSIIQQMKAIKNDTEIELLRQAMRKDGVALVQMYRWLEKTLQERPVPETEVADMLSHFRKAQGGYHGESFAAIVGFKGNGAIVHYHAEEGKCAQIEGEGMLLVDSGGQYDEGTTDITRTIYLGTPSEQQKRHYTLVLKGNIGLAMAEFPYGTTGVQLDTLARLPLWQDHLNYGHGTGHGVGHLLNVHEGPQGIVANPRTTRGQTIFEAGMVTSNEPGFYLAGQYGIRIENLVLCKKVESTDFGQFLGFEDLTLFPIDTDLIQVDLLTEAEKQWLNDYHRKVWEEVSPGLNAEEKAWLEAKCQEI